MLILPPANTPLNQHSLKEIEFWLKTLGAEKCIDNPCLWKWVTSKWSAKLFVRQDELTVVWDDNDEKSQFGFPYGLFRGDIEEALKHGP